MSARARPAVAVVAAPVDAEMLCEWLTAAGFDAVHLDEQVCLVPSQPIAACLVRWPVDVELSTLPRPVVLLYEPGADLRSAVGRVAEVLPVPDSRDVHSLLEWSSQLSSTLRHLTAVRTLAQAPSPVAEPVVAAERAVSRAAEPAGPSLIAIGVSTGGPTSLRVLFEGLRGARLPPILVVQHIPANFVPDLIQRLGDQTGYRFALAEDGMALQAGIAYFAPGDAHVRVEERGGALRARRSDEAPFRGHRPSVEVMFDSCADLQRPGLAVMMTGMGRDGAVAMRRLRDLGWATVGQDEATCAIYGMPQAAREEGATSRELPLDQLAPWLVAQCRRRGVVV